MRTLRKVLCILCLVVLLTSSAAWAAPATTSDDAPSILSWLLSVVDSLLPDWTPGEASQSLEDGEIPPNEVGGGVDPNG